MEDFSIKLSHLLSVEHWGIVKRYNENYLKQSLQRLLGNTDVNVMDAYIEAMANDISKQLHFVEILNNSTSCFFRNNLSFSVLEQIVLPEIFARKTKLGSKSMRIWSMAAAGGQELYSVAILLDELKYLHNGSVDIQLFASDMCEQQLHLAQQGLFKYKDIEQLTEKRLKRYFDLQSDGYYAIKKELIDSVAFNFFDLTDTNYTCPPESVFGDFDLVICANVLIYYNNEHVDQIFEKICKSMASKAYVMTGESERDLFVAKGFAELMQQSGIFTRKKM